MTILQDYFSADLITSSQCCHSQTDKHRVGHEERSPRTCAAAARPPGRTTLFVAHIAAGMGESKCFVHYLSRTHEEEEDETSSVFPDN